ncbi:endoribonuclease MazF [Candidatus Peregrinibacteria bacterium]|nr:endoribonuclease MazF [Candidatus Peregrinibacteria bacterium]
MVKSYVPQKGDIVLLDFNPQSGKEQSGKRPAVVLSPGAYNAKVGLAIFCPITSKIKGYPFEVVLDGNLKTKGVALSDHVKNLDWRARNVRFQEKLTRRNLHQILEKLELLLFE